MAVLEEILKWSAELPAWQSDALARLLTRPQLTDQDEEDILALLRAAHGIPDPMGRIPRALTADQIPAPQANGTTVTINAIKNLRHVNALAENQRLEFGATGLTVIYGDNGSGKSGYSRVLKRACRARDQDESIHPNANVSAEKHGVAQAAFEISVDGTPMEVEWVASDVAPPELSSLAIFDSRCARAYLDNEDDFSFIPYGLDVFERLGKLCKGLQTTLEREQNQSTPDLSAFAHLHGNNEVGALVANLSARTSIEKIEKLGSLSEEEFARLSELSTGLKESDPKAKALVFRGKASRCNAIADRLLERASVISSAKVEALRTLCRGYRMAKEAAAIAAKEFDKEQNLLPGTGGDAWRELFDAARRFAVESYPEHTFPDLGSDGLCPLCQQPLGQGAVRLKHFEEFLHKETERVARMKKDALAAVYKPFSMQTFDVGLDDVTLAEIEELEESLGKSVRLSAQAMKARHAAVLNAALTDNWSGLEEEVAHPSALLKVLASRLNSEAVTLQEAADDTARIALQKEMGLLDARFRLLKSKPAVISAVNKLVHLGRLSECIRALKTNAISAKAGQLTEQAVSKELADALNAEFSSLGVSSLRVTIKSRTVRGKALHKLVLNLPQSKSPGDILSEGEQRAVSIASFLGEVNLLSPHAGVIFDDPMSSLDHKRRERVSRRLTQEATKRQVIIFTHDIYFVCLLTEEAQSVGVPILTQSLTRRPIGFGVADPELPFEGRTTGRRLKALKTLQQGIAKLHRDGEEQEWAKQTVDAYFRLRMTWERAVEEVLFKGVVTRFGKGIKTQMLSEVVVDDGDYAAVFQGMTKCSNYAHDKALAGGTALPEPHELLADIEGLDSWRTAVEARSKVTRERRKS